MLDFQFKKLLKREPTLSEKFVGGEATGMVAVESQCQTCTHNRGNGKCTAFPEGIPVGFLTGDFDHSKPYPGDNGIRYEPK